ncbi:MAG TPA: tetratricopeptide repeat protein [Burkholderiales bacterium]|nr:tetratricopeptide repeat protein [Burkholderiales bacterium]
MQAKAVIRVAAAMVLLLAASAAMTADPLPSQGDSALKNVLRELWVRLRAVGPRQPTQVTSHTVTAGIRGAEATESELRPYWKGDREQDPAYRAEQQELKSAQDLADAGNFAEAAKAFGAFADAHPRSPLVPEARFGAALSQAAMGEKARATSGFESFLKQNPQHPLARDAERALAALR